MVASFQVDHFPLTRELLEVIKIERPVYRVQPEYPLVALASVEDFHLKKLKRKVKVGHRFQRTEGRCPQNIPQAGRKLLGGFFAGDVGSQAADAGHFWSPMCLKRVPKECSIGSGSRVRVPSQ